MDQDGQKPQHSRHGSRVLRSPGSKDVNERKRNFASNVNDERTISYIKRILCDQPKPLSPLNESAAEPVHSKSLDELLPPLTSSNEVDVQLYAITAVILKQFVQSWYSRITPNNEFVAEIVSIIAHCTRGVEQRVRHVDLEELLLDELPALLVAHLDAVTVAQAACSSDRSQNQVRLIYQAVRPNKALVPLPDDQHTSLEQRDNEVAWSQLLVSRVLPLVLPPEDLRNPCLHVLVSEIFSEMIVHNAICGKSSEPWIIWEGVTKLIYNTLRPKAYHPYSPTDESTTSINRLEQFGLLSNAEAKQVQSLQHLQRRRRDVIALVFWSTLYLLSMVWTLLRSLTTALMHESSIPARSTRSVKKKTSDRLSVTAVDPDSRPNLQEPFDRPFDKRPVLGMRIWSCISKLTALEHRMPWLFGYISLLKWLSLYGPGQICRTNGALDRLMSSEISKRLFRAGLLPPLLQAIRGAIFPDNALAPTRQPPTSAEVAEIKRDCAVAILEAIPKPVRSRYFATKDADLMRQDVESTLDLFADSYINKHFIISAVELLVVRLFPELGEDGMEE